MTNTGTAPTRALLAALLLCCTAPLVQAQSLQPQAAAGVRFESYSFSSPDRVDIERIDLLTLPVTARLMVGRSIEFGVSGAYARAALTRRDGEATLSGPTDTELRLTFRTARDRLRLGVVALLPTGTSELSAVEMDIAGLIAADVLPFAITSWGSGGGIGFNAAVAVPLDRETSIGASAGYVVAREYEPLGDAETFAYRPGNQLHARVAIDRTFGSATKASLQLGYQQFGSDEQAGANLYQAGDRLQALASLAFAAGAGSAIVYAGYLKRESGHFTDIVRVTPAQDMVYGGAALRQPLGGVVLLPLADVRVLGSDDGFNEGYTASAGLGVEVPLGALELVPLARARFGSLTVRTDQESRFTGLELGLTLRSRMFSR